MGEIADILDDVMFLYSDDDSNITEIEIIEDYISGGGSGGGGEVISQPFQEIAFANPLNIDASVYKNWKCLSITGDTVINLNNSVNGNSGQIRIDIDSVGGYTISLGEVFTKQIGIEEINTEANVTTVITWSNDGTDVLYTIGPST